MLSNAKYLHILPINTVFYAISDTFPRFSGSHSKTGKMTLFGAIIKVIKSIDAKKSLNSAIKLEKKTLYCVFGKNFSNQGFYFFFF